MVLPGARTSKQEAPVSPSGQETWAHAGKRGEGFPTSLVFSLLNTILFLPYGTRRQNGEGEA